MELGNNFEMKGIVIGYFNGLVSDVNHGWVEYNMVVADFVDEPIAYYIEYNIPTEFSGKRMANFTDKAEADKKYYEVLGKIVDDIRDYIKAEADA